MSKQNFKTILSVFAILFFTQYCKAQNDSLLKPTTIEVIQSYKPELKQVPKPEFHPSLPPKDTSKPNLKYEIPQQTLYYSYTSLPLRPLALGKDTTQLPPSSYVKFGVGNFSTLYLDGGTTRLHGKNYETSIHLHHLSQDGMIANQQISLSGMEAEGSFHHSEHSFFCNLTLWRNVYHYYGYDHDVYKFNESAVRQQFSGFDFKAAAKNDFKNNLGIDYKPSIAFSHIADAYSTLERNLIVDAPFTKSLASNTTVGAGINGNFVFYSSNNYEYNNNLVRFSAFGDFIKNKFQLHAGLYPTFSMEKSFLMPAFSISFGLPKIQSRISIGMENSLKQNTFKQLSNYNPYLFTSYSITPTKVTELYSLLQSEIEDHYLFSARFSWKQIENLPEFLNDFADQKQFYVVNDTMVRSVCFNTSMHYQVANTFSLGGSFTYNYYYKHSFDKVWHEPALSFLVDMKYHPRKKFWMTSYMNLIAKNYALNSLHETIQLDPIFDMGIGAEYALRSKFSLFFNAQNLLNNKYERWYHYQTYGFNVFGGIRLKF